MQSHPFAGDSKTLIGLSKHAKAAHNALALCEERWDKPEQIVVCDANDYPSALVAAGLARRLRAPLLFFDGQEVLREVSKIAEQAKEVIAVGAVPDAWNVIEDDNPSSINPTVLPDAIAVGRWLRQQGMPIRYLAVVNPLDRGAAVGDRMSMAAPILAGSREGLVVPISMKMRWKLPFLSKPLPEGDNSPKSKKRWHRGAIELDGQVCDFLLSSGNDAKHFRSVSFDLNHNGRFDDPGEGPLTQADRVRLGGADWIIKRRQAVRPRQSRTLSDVPARGSDSVRDSSVRPRVRVRAGAAVHGRLAAHAAAVDRPPVRYGPAERLSVREPRR